MRSATDDAPRLATDGDHPSADGDLPASDDDHPPADSDLPATDGDHPPSPTPQFTDVQRVRDTDLFAALLVTLLPALAVVALAVWWSAPSDPTALGVLAGIAVVVVGCLALAYATQLVVTVDSETLAVHVEPFDRRPLTVPHAEITDYRVEPDTPTGHGIALGSGRHAWWLDSITYGVGDCECVHVEWADRRPIHVGSARADELVRALDGVTADSTATTD
jgi:hypothetical protein